MGEIMLLSKIIEPYSNELEILNFKELNIIGIQTDSRLIKENDIFFAIDGFTTNGIDFADKAIENGAKVIVCDKKYNYENNNVVIIKCDDVKDILGKFLNAFYFNKPKYIISLFFSIFFS